MELIWIILGSIFIITGIIGSFLPVMPGPPFGYIGLLIMQFGLGAPFSWTFFLIWGAVVALVLTFDSLVPAEGARRMGGSRYGVYGCLLGAIIGLFVFPPAGIILGPIAGAFIGEMISGKSTRLSIRAAMGSFVGFLVATLIKAGVSGVFAYYFFSNI